MGRRAWPDKFYIAFPEHSTDPKGHRGSNGPSLSNQSSYLCPAIWGALRGEFISSFSDFWKLRHLIESRFHVSPFRLGGCVFRRFIAGFSTI